MAINVNTVYRTVLLILNKEQRGYITPTEFAKIATQVQLEIFEEYFESLNQQLRVPDNDSEYADRIQNLDGSLSIFKTIANATHVSGGEFSLPANLYRLGSVIYNDENEVNRVQRNDLLYITMSPLTRPTVKYPLYLYENGLVKLRPATITSGISLSYVRKPLDVVWNFTATALTNYQYVYDPTGSVDFELAPSEQTNVINRILMYSGLVINNPEIIQVAAGQIQADQINSKS